MTVILAIARYLGFAGCCVVFLLVYYEGIPGAYRVPFLSSLPIVGDITTGKVHSYAAEQVRIATAQQRAVCDGKLEKLVSVAELAAANATIARERALRRMADEATAEADRRASESEKAKASADAKLEQILKEAAQDPDLSRPTEKDREWQAKH
ncbi:hypothetical protein A6U87_16590 [Rhizobium sp. AC44/96]|uniref:hypothetical protein n=1 Tax=Rhizobium sp. AC44/96 TaxID=1841654 RepID=UPI00080F8767|nr:hypothetical protein [Rhizobium sp. AC44/96]OCJ04449.1 hypothetical protein A6U87_16590 [Rhizobium sp. AC44/96]